MIFDRTGTISILLGLAFLVTQLPANAATVVYGVSDTSINNCNSTGGLTGGEHGLWTGTDFSNINGSDCSGGKADENYFSIQSGTLTVVEGVGGTATLSVTAMNAAGAEADIDLVFSMFLDALGGLPYKDGGGPANSSTQDYYQEVLGTIAIGSVVYDIDDMVGAYTFQLGDGANDKDGAFGASAWIQSCGNSDKPALTAGQSHGCMISGHWDLNLSLVEIDRSTVVPLPAAAWFFGSALIGLAGIGRRRQRATT